MHRDIRKFQILAASCFTVLCAALYLCWALLTGSNGPSQRTLKAKEAEDEIRFVGPIVVLRAADNGGNLPEFSTKKMPEWATAEAHKVKADGPALLAKIANEPVTFKVDPAFAGQPISVIMPDGPVVIEQDVDGKDIKGNTADGRIKWYR